MTTADSKVVKSAAKRRPPNAGKGRKKGVPNKATKTAREAIARIADGHAEDFIGWVKAVADGDDNRPANPEGAAKLYLAAIEYHVPKLARTELTGKDGGPVVVTASAKDERL